MWLDQNYCDYTKISQETAVWLYLSHLMWDRAHPTCPYVMS